MNQVCLSGYLAADPKPFMSGGNSGSEIRIGETYYSKGAHTTRWHTCVAFNKTADFLNNHFKKGQPIIVFGTLDYNKWEKDGHKFEKSKIFIHLVEFPPKLNPAKEHPLDKPPADEW